MKRILSSEQHKKADRRASALGLPSMVLMERAALAVVDEMETCGMDLSGVLVLCGTGNNAGDGAAIARIVAERGFVPTVFAIGDPAKYSEQMKLQMHILESCSVKIIHAYREENEKPFIPDELDFSGYTVIVDAVFGIGVSRKITGFFAEVIDAVNAERGEVPVVAVDMPSGVHTDTGEVCGTAVTADLTVTFTTGKSGLYLYPGAAKAGRVAVKKIGIPVPADMEKDCRTYAVEDADICRIPARDESGNKGTFRKLLVIAGSEEIAGAAYLSAKAALLCGIGMVRIFTHEKNRTPMAVLLPEALMTVYSEKSDIGTLLEKDLSWADAVLIGPGLGTGVLSLKILRSFLEQNAADPDKMLPAVFDADALNLLASHPELFSLVKGEAAATPHIGEMGRLTGYSSAEIKANALRIAQAAAADTGKTIVLKDARTVTALPDGRCFINLSGNSSLSTAGSGDVLAGMTAAFLALFGEEVRGVPTVPLAVYIHGKCGEAAGEKWSESSATAGDLLEFIHAFLP